MARARDGAGATEADPSPIATPTPTPDAGPGLGRLHSRIAVKPVIGATLRIHVRLYLRIDAGDSGLGVGSQAWSMRCKARGRCSREVEQS